MHPITRRPFRRLTPAGIALAICYSCGSRHAIPRRKPDSSQPRARDLGVTPGLLEPGPLNAITDVDGVRVGHVTVVEGDDVRTGVTAILAHGGDIFQHKVPAAAVVMNGFGKLVGSTQLDELGQLETPILLTNTLAVWSAANAIVDHVLAQPGNHEVRSVNPIVGETNDGWLNEIRKRSLTDEHFRRAILEAMPGPVREGAVGAGTGTRAFGFKGGIGTASRRLSANQGGFTVGVLVQTNFGGSLTIAGVPVGELLERGQDRAGSHDGSCMIVLATDAPLDARQLRRLARRAFAGMARTGASFSHGSGDYALAFSTAEQVRISHARDRVAATAVLDDETSLSPLFQAAADATEEAIIGSLVAATTMSGRDGHVAEALPIEETRKLLERRR